MKRFFFNPLPSVDDEWQDMPEFVHEDLSPHRTIKMHFRSDADVIEFFKVIGQRLPLAPYCWYPEMKRQDYSDRLYVDMKNKKRERLKR